MKLLLLLSLVTVSLAKLRTATPVPIASQSPQDFKDACNVCNKVCPINCKVGYCGYQYGFTVQRLEYSPLCYTCAAAPLQPSAPDPPYQLCPNPAPPVEPSSVFPKPSPGMARLGENAPPGTPAESIAAAQAAVATAVTKADSAKTAAGVAAQHALNVYNAMNQHLSQNSGGSREADAKAAAARDAANKALLVAEAAQNKWKDALKVYNDEATSLRAIQLRTFRLEEVLQKKLEASEVARVNYVKLHKLAEDAGKDAALGGGQATNILDAQQKALEAAAHSLAAQRKMVITASVSDDAADWLARAAAINLPNSPVSQPTIPPCSAVLLQGKVHKDCNQETKEDAASVDASLSWMR